MQVTSINVHHQRPARFKLEVSVLHSVFHVIARRDIVEIVSAEG